MNKKIMLRFYLNVQNNLWNFLIFLIMF